MSMNSGLRRSMKNSAYPFAAEVDRLIEDLPNEEFHCKTVWSKQLLEELLPLSRLALHLKLPGLTVEVEAFEKFECPDGYIRIIGFREQEFEVQTTYAGYDHKEALRAELLTSQGFVPGAGKIERDRKSGYIEATMGALDPDEHIVRMSAAVMNRISEKAVKPYPQGTVLLVAFEEIKLRGHSAWTGLFSAIAQTCKLARNQFTDIYLFNGATNEIRRAP